MTEQELRERLEFLISASEKEKKYLNIIELLINNVDNYENILSEIYNKYNIYFYMKNNRILFIYDDAEAQSNE